MSRFLTFALAAFCNVSAVTAGEVDYLTQVKPLLTEKCYSCHGVLKQESSLRLETRDLILAGGDGGEVIVPGDPDASPIIERVRSTDSDRMPPQEQGSALTDDQVSLLENWIRQGANAPAEAIPTSPEQHWAFQPIVRPPMPASRPKPGGVVASNPIDVLLEAKHASRSLRAQGQAERSLQLRRLYLDLLGLPPTSVQLSDARPWTEIVDELLNDPHHGERWARHWMDVWRYSDWYGLGDQLRNSQKHLWHWRDWIIDSLNRDKGYDRMILEMIAGDELAPDDLSVLAATGFLARNYYLFNRTTWLDNTIEHTSKAFLGLTINCAKCHDHKYDPITQLDYYRLRAIFEPHQVRLDPVPGVIDLEADGLPRVFDDGVTIPTYLHVRGDPKNPDTDREITAGVPEILEGFAPAIEPVPLPASAYAPGVRDYVRHDHLRHAESEVRLAEKELAEAARALSESPHASTEPPNPSDPNATVSIAEAKLKAAAAKLRSLEATFAADQAKYLGADSGEVTRLAQAAAKMQADWQLTMGQYKLLADAADNKKREAAKQQIASAKEKLLLIEKGECDYESFRATRKALESPADKESDYPPAYSATSTGRRLALARWLTSPDNPLTARVAVNHVWMRHFGTPLVESVFDFGLRAPRPEQADVLDLLAAELIESGWSLKRLHRLIVTSDAYRRSSSTLHADPRCMETDPGNQLYWRMNPRRMESQVVRDSLLAFSGQLDRTIGGPSLDHDHNPPRRSLYFKHSPDQQDKFLEMFDNADVLSCYRRSESIVPQQALALANSHLAISVAERIADSIHASHPETDRRTFIDAVFRTLLARPATDDEISECERFLEQLDGPSQSEPSGPSRGRSRLVHAILNHNDFITIR